MTLHPTTTGHHRQITADLLRLIRYHQRRHRPPFSKTGRARKECATPAARFL